MGCSKEGFWGGSIKYCDLKEEGKLDREKKQALVVAVN